MAALGLLYVSLAPPWAAASCTRLALRASIRALISCNPCRVLLRSYPLPGGGGMCVVGECVLWGSVCCGRSVCYGRSVGCGKSVTMVGACLCFSMQVYVMYKPYNTTHLPTHPTPHPPTSNHAPAGVAAVASRTPPLAPALSAAAAAAAAAAIDPGGGVPPGCLSNGWVCSAS